jgi:uncharacterized protein YcbX
VTHAIGRVDQIYRYPVKSMAGSRLTEARLGWHGLDGDRRFAFRRRAERGAFPWLSASRLPELILYRPCDGTGAAADEPTHVRTPDGRVLDLWGRELADEIGQRFQEGVEVMQLRAGIFDEAPVSILATATVGKLETESGRSLDIRRFRPNVVVTTAEGRAFEEDAWVGRSLRFGAEPEAAVVAVTLRDLRCVMINLDPDTAAADASVLKTAVRLNANQAGVYGTVLSPGTIGVGQEVFLVEAGGPARA